MEINREIEGIYCSCSGEVKQKETTNEEEEKYGCGRKGCCVRAVQCNKCGTRFTIALEVPDYGG